MTKSVLLYICKYAAFSTFTENWWIWRCFLAHRHYICTQHSSLDSNVDLYTV